MHAVRFLALMTISVITPAALAGNAPSTAKPGSPQSRGMDPAQYLGVMLQVDNLLDAYREEHREKHFNAEVERQFAVVEEAGVRWVRAGILWNQVERKAGHYDWEAVEMVLHAANRHHVHLVWLVGGMPLWNSRGGTEGLPRQLPDPHFREFLTRLRNRYGGQKDREHPLKGSIHYWEIINEPNYHWRPEQYAIVLTEAHDVLQRDEGAKIVFGGLGGDILGNSKDVHEGNQVKFFEKVVRSLPEGKRPFDFANFHLYGNDADRFFDKNDDAIEAYFARCQHEIEAALQRTGLEDVPVWSTEFDYPSAVKHQVRGRYKGHSAEEGLEKQALFLKEWFPKVFASQSKRKIFWASLVDDVNDEGAFLSTGIVHWRSSDDKHAMGPRKAAYQALKQFFNGR